MRRSSSESGAALIGVLLWAAALMPLAGWLALQARLEWSFVRALRSDMECFYVAEAGMARALAVLNRLPSAEGALKGPDGVAGTADDGGLFGPPDTRIRFSEAPFSYATRLESAGGGLVRVRSTGHGRDGALAQLEVLVRWADGGIDSWWREVL